MARLNAVRTPLPESAPKCASRPKGYAKGYPPKGAGKYCGKYRKVIRSADIAEDNAPMQARVTP